MGNGQGSVTGATLYPRESAPPTLGRFARGRANYPVMKVQRSEPELGQVPEMTRENLSQKQRQEDIRAAARANQGDQIQLTLARLMEQNMELVQTMRDLRG